jgi:hypothetical protein
MDAGTAVGKAAVGTAGTLKRSAETIGMTVLDQNDDGKLDQADLKIATERAGRVSKAAINEIGSSETAKGAATAAAIGAVIAVPVPLVGPAIGAAVAATGYVAVKAVGKVGEAVGTAVGGIRGRAPRTRKRKETITGKT